MKVLFIESGWEFPVAWFGKVNSVIREIIYLSFVFWSVPLSGGVLSIEFDCSWEELDFQLIVVIVSQG